MTERNLNSEPPSRHREYLLDREDAVSNGEDSFTTLDEFGPILKELKREQTT